MPVKKVLVCPPSALRGACMDQGLICGDAMHFAGIANASLDEAEDTADDSAPGLACSHAAPLGQV